MFFRHSFFKGIINDRGFTIINFPRFEKRTIWFFIWRRIKRFYNLITTTIKSLENFHRCNKSRLFLSFICPFKIDAHVLQWLIIRRIQRSVYDRASIDTKRSALFFNPGNEIVIFLNLLISFYSLFTCLKVRFCNNFT